MTTNQRRRYRTATQGASRHYPIPLQLRYKATSKLGSVDGFGKTKVISSKDIVFGPSHGLRPGMKAEIVVAWPRLLDDQIRLQLVLQVTITGSQNGEAKGRIRAYDFRTRRAAEAE